MSVKRFNKRKKSVANSLAWIGVLNEVRRMIRVEGKPFEVSDLIDVIHSERELERIGFFAANVDEFLREGKAPKMVRNDSDCYLGLLTWRIEKFLKEFGDGNVVRVGGKEYRLAEIKEEEKG